VAIGESFRLIPAGFDRRRLGEIDDRLKSIELDHQVRIGLAVESGSRAWGFPSPDSDFDCRFLFVRRAADYLSPWQRRDVIEIELDRELDINGWELGKALKLMLKGNAVILEWLRSPILYSGDVRFHQDLAALASRYSDRNGIARHYLHLGERQRHTYFADGKQVALKKLFYALRPAAALRWMRLHPEANVPPMHFPTLMAECDPPVDLDSIVAELIRRKAATRELGSAPLPQPVERFIDAEFGLARETLPARSSPLDLRAKEAAECFFRSTVQRLAPADGSTPRDTHPK
jgi:predicted nucleotidyltransferase